jgi:hypothetical protein
MSQLKPSTLADAVRAVRTALFQLAMLILTGLAFLVLDMMSPDLGSV